MKGLRQSKWKHIHGELQKEKFEEIKPNASTTESSHVKSNGKFLGVSWSGAGGSLAVIPIASKGRQPANLPLLKGHAGAILDFEFSPFHDELVATASEDSTVKIWQVPEEGLTEDILEPVGTLQGHIKKVLFSTWNPVADFILASTAFDKTVKIWDVEDQVEASNIELPDTLTSLQWNQNGSLLIGACKDKEVKILDPRASAVTVNFHAHDSARSSKALWINGTPDVFSVGFSRMAEREMALWDTRNTSEAVTRKVLDKTAGVLQPFYDYDSGVLFLAGKGDGNIRIYEVESEAPYFHETHVQYGSTSSTKSIGCIPKRAVDVSKNEIMRFYKLNNQSVIEEISFDVPRRSDQFQPDLYPDCNSIEPALSGKAWLGGENAEPKKQSLNPAAGQQASPKKLALGGGASAEALKEIAELKTEIETLKGENEALKANQGDSASLTEENTQLKEKVSALTTELESSTEDQKKRISQLEAELAEAKETASTSNDKEAEDSSSSEEVTKLTNELNELKEYGSTLVEEVDTLQQKLKDAQTRLDDTEGKVTTLTNENEELKTEGAAIERMLQQRDEEIATLRSAKEGESA